ncbi:MAG: hypothetical protein IPN19_06035 [Elusimicrobia bacterium]|nr:hypothetical protein [Elusimicrobiota bacterium]
MIFLSLANVLHDGVVWKSVGVDPHIQRAIREIPDYGQRDPGLKAPVCGKRMPSRSRNRRKKKMKGATHGF